MAKESWIEKTVRRLENIEKYMDEKNRRKLFLPNLKKAIIRIDEFSSKNCEECEQHKETVDQLIISLTTFNKNRTKFKRSDYMNSLSKIMNHMKTKHELVPKGKYESNAMNFGSLAAAVLGILTANIMVPLIIMAFAKFSGFVFEKHAQVTERHL